jgi:hypothetical protein
MKVLVSKEDSWKLDSSMFIIDGSWETGYVYDENIFFMVGVTSYCEVGASWSNLALKAGPRARLLVTEVTPGRYNMYLQQYCWNWEPHEEATQVWYDLSWGQVMDLALTKR